MKKAFILLSSAVLLLTGCTARPHKASSADESATVHEFESGETVYIKEYYYEGYDKYAYLIINASGEIRTGYDEHPYYHSEFPDYIAKLSQKSPSYTLSAEETEALLSYIARINPESPWISDDHEDYPDAEVIHTYEFCLLNGEMTRVRNHSHYADYLNDENAKASVSFINALDFVKEWDYEVNVTMFAQYKS